MADVVNPRRHVLLATIGSSGDVHPFVGLGRRLLARGHRVTLITAEYFRPLAESAGLEFAGCSAPGIDYCTVIHNPELWHPIKGPCALLWLAVQPMLRPMYHAIVERYMPDETVVVASSFAFGARVAQDQLGIPVVSMHVSPAVFRSDYQGPVLPYLRVDRGPAWLRHLQWAVFDRFAGDKYTCPWLNAFRTELALPPVQHPLRSWWHSPLKVLGMFPEWFAPQQPDWPAQCVQVGFPLHDVPESTAVSDEVQDFVANGEPPLVFMATSAQRFGHEFYAAAVEACTRLRRRGVLLTAFAEQIPTSLPSHVRHAPFVPLSWLLPRSAAMVHNGGIGALSQAMNAGIPQLMSPLAFDQFDNTARAARLGVGYSLKARTFSAQLTGAITRLLADEGVQERCRHFQQRLIDQDALSHACAEIDAVLPPASHSSTVADIPHS